MSTADHVLDEAGLARLRAVADRLIPEAHGMPSAATVVDERRVGFVLGSRPDLRAALVEALRPELGDDPSERLGLLGAEPDALAALELVIVSAYYTDAEVRRLIGYPGQIARPVDAHAYPEYVSEGLLDAVIGRGPIWRDPARAPAGTEHAP